MTDSKENVLRAIRSEYRLSETELEHVKRLLVQGQESSMTAFYAQASLYQFLSTKERLSSSKKASFLVLPTKGEKVANRILWGEHRS